MTDAALARDRLGQDAAQERRGDGELQAREIIRHRARQADLAHDHQRMRAERPQHVAQLGLDRRDPAATFTVIGKKLIRNEVMTAGKVPIPNQITRIGTTATLGMLLKAIRSG